MELIARTKQFLVDHKILSIWYNLDMKHPEIAFNKIVDKQKICYLGTIGKDGYPHITAMLAPRKHNGIKEFFLSTSTSSQKVGHLRQNSKASLYFCDRRFYRGLEFKGSIEILEDQDSKTMLWEKGDTMFYKEGVTDPDYCVLKFTADSARYYNNLKTTNVKINNIVADEQYCVLDTDSDRTISLDLILYIYQIAIIFYSSVQHILIKLLFAFE